MAVKIYGSNRIDLDGNNETFSIRATTDDELNFYKGASTKLMGIDASGFESKPNIPAFYAYLDSPYSDAALGVIACNIAQINTGGYYNTTNYAFTAPIAGNYFVSCHLSGYTTDTQGDDSQWLGIYINNISWGGNAGSRSSMNNLRYHTTSGVELTVSWSAIVYLEFGDFIQMFYGDVQSNTTVSNANFIGYLIG